MKLAMIVSTVLILGQVNVCLARKATIPEVDRLTTAITKNSKESLDSVRDAIANGKLQAGRDLVSAIQGSLDGFATKLGMGRVENVIVVMPHVIKSLAFIHRVETLKKTTEADPHDVSFSNLLKSVITRLSSRVISGAGPESAVLNNLFDNGIHIREELTPFLMKIDGYLEAGMNEKVAVRKAVEEQMALYNSKDQTIKSKFEDFRNARKCTGKMH
ncbi:MAG: hypothetical protein IPK04_19255 [Bdellovibrionales bacterium]|nr:hypothetical protein [Bdellovibrionales bacterium]